MKIDGIKLISLETCFCVGRTFFYLFFIIIIIIIFCFNSVYLLTRAWRKATSTAGTPANQSLFGPSNHTTPLSAVCEIFYFL